MIDNYDDIQAPFRTKLLTVVQQSEVAWENKDYEPTQGQIFIKEDLMHGSEDPSATNEVSQTGIMQYSVLTPIGSGTKDVKKKADEIKHAFKPGTILSNKVYCNSASVVNGQNANGWYSKLVQIAYTLYAPNS